MGLFIKGLIIGFIIVLPGMSGGTVFLIFGLYENIVKDLLSLRIKRYIPLAAGIVAGIFSCGYAFGWFFENYRDITVAFLLGCLLASTRAVLRDCPEKRPLRLVIMALGVLTGWLMMADPVGIIELHEVKWWLLMLGGALASAAMIIPGIPGSSVMMLFGVYDTMMVSIKNLLFTNLLYFGAGSLLGIFLLLNLLAKLYDKYKAIVSYFFAGLIIGSTRGTIPSQLNWWTALLPVAGFVIVWFWSGSGTDGKEVNEAAADNESAVDIINEAPSLNAPEAETHSKHREKS